MSKRLNPHRRLLAKQATVRRDVQQYANASDAGKLQEGRVRSSLSPVIQLSGYATPRPATWEGRGKPGKIVRGQLKVDHLKIPLSRSRDVLRTPKDKLRKDLSPKIAAYLARGGTIKEG